MDALPKQGMLVIKIQRTQVFLAHQSIDGAIAVSSFNVLPKSQKLTQHNQEQDGSL